MNFYKHHLGDYDGATTHLSWDEDMAYTRLLRAYYRLEGPIACNQTYRLARASSKAQRAAVDSVLGEYFDRVETVWHNDRADEEIEAYQAQADTNRRIAKGRKRQRTVNESSDEPNNEPSTNRTPNLEPRTKNQEKYKNRAVALDWLPPEWQEFEQHRKEKRQALTATARRGCIAKLERWKGEGKDIAAILRNSIDNGYTGLFEIGAKPNGSGGVTAGNVAAAQEFVRRGKLEDDHEKPAS